MTPSLGSSFPDLLLPDHNGSVRSLASLAAGDPVLVQTYRGFWCPKEQAFLRLLTALQDEAEVAYTRFVSISVDPPGVEAAFRAGLGARWTFLSDEDRTYLEPLGLAEVTDTEHHPYLPACFVLDPDLVVRAAWNGYWFWGRPTMEELRSSFREVTRSIRSDWEPPTS